MATNMSAIIPIPRQGDRGGQGASTRRPGRRRRTSGVWDFLELVPAAASSGAQDRALCPTCLKYLTAGSTSHLLRHRCYLEWLIKQQAPPPVPLPAAPAAAPPPVPLPAAPAAAPPPASPVIAVAEEDYYVFMMSGLQDIIPLP